MVVLVTCVLVRTVLCTVSFLYIYSYLSRLYYPKDYCHQVTTQLQLVVVVVVVVVVFSSSSSGSSGGGSSSDSNSSSSSGTSSGSGGF